MIRETEIENEVRGRTILLFFRKVCSVAFGV